MADAKSNPTAASGTGEVSSDLKAAYPIFAAIAAAQSDGSAPKSSKPKTIEIQDGNLTFVVDARIEAEMAADKAAQKKEFDAAKAAIAAAPKKSFASGAMPDDTADVYSYNAGGEKRMPVLFVSQSAWLSVIAEAWCRHLHPTVLLPFSAAINEPAADAKRPAVVAAAAPTAAASAATDTKSAAAPAAAAASAKPTAASILESAPAFIPESIAVVLAEAGVPLSALRVRTVKQFEAAASDSKHVGFAFVVPLCAASAAANVKALPLGTLSDPLSTAGATAAAQLTAVREASAAIRKLVADLPSVIEMMC